MKKLILLFIIGFTSLIAIEFKMTESGLYPYVETQIPTTPVTTPSPDNWIESPLPTNAFNVLDYGLKGDGKTDDSAALNALAKNTNVTNWYFPTGKQFRLNAVNIPSHVRAVYGGGTIVSISTGGTGYQLGALYTNAEHQDLIIDGLTFKGESGYAGNQYYGQLQLSSDGESTNNTQIRNCTFDAALRRANSLRVFARVDPTGGDHTNLRIYNNTFINGQYFAMEIFNNTTSDYVTDDMEGLRGLHIYRNNISGTSAWGIGIGRIRTESYIYNNDVDVNKFGVEIIQSNNNHTYNNNLGARNGHTLSQGVIDIKGAVMTPGINYIHHNHFYGLTADIYHGSNSEIYENFFGCFVVLRGDIGSNQTMLGNFHNNTIVSNNASPVKISDMTTNGIFQDNDIYGTTSYTDTYTVYLNNVGTNINIINNNSYIKNSNTCIQSGATQSGNICNSYYKGTVPTSRQGAGNI